MNIQSSHLSNEKIKLLAACPVCHKQYDQPNAKIVNETDEAYLLHVHCNGCGSSVMALIFTTGIGVTSMGILTDLNRDDMNKFCESEGINQDEVLQMYQYLKKRNILIS